MLEIKEGEKKMNSLWKIVRTLMTVIGGILVFGAVGTSDYYVLELGQPEPSSVWTTIVIGIVMMLPFFTHMVYQIIKENQDANN